MDGVTHSTSLMSWKGLIKVIFVACLFYFLAKKGFLSIDLTIKAFQRVEHSFPALFCLLMAVLISFFRWHLLMRAQQLVLSFSKVFSLGFIGMFFNLALPGSVTGDIVKAFYVAKEAPGMRGRAFGAILFDRIIGLSGQLVVAFSALLISYSELSHSPLLLGVRTAFLIGGVGFGVFFLYLFIVPENRDYFLKILKTLEIKNKKLGSLVRIYEGIKHYREQKKSVFLALLLSIVLHFLVTLACWQFAQALGEHQLSLLSMLVVVPLALLVTAVPILPAGIGTGHAALGWLIHLLGSERGADLYSLFAISQIILGVWGGLLYLKYRHVPSNSS